MSSKGATEKQCALWWKLHNKKCELAKQSPATLSFLVRDTFDDETGNYNNFVADQNEKHSVF